MRRLRSYELFLLLLCNVFLLSQCSLIRHEAAHRSAAEKPGVFKSDAGRKKYIQSYNKTLGEWPVRFKEYMVPTTFGSSHVIVCGDENAPPLILMHGLNASSTMWYPNIKDFAAHFHVFAIDFILEPGKSIPSESTLSKDETITWYEEIFAHFNLQKYSIVGASRGGWFAMAVALKSQEKINKLVLLSPAQTLAPIRMKKKVFTNLGFALFPRKAKLKKILSTLSVHENQLSKSYVNQFYLASRYAKINKSIFEMVPFSDQELKSLKIPVMILIGDHDIINDEKGLKRAENLPDAETAVIQDAGHFLSFDQPGLVDKKILRFLIGETP